MLDTDVVVAGFRSENGVSRQLLKSVLDRRIVMLLSVPLMLEYEAVLTRPEHVMQIGLTASEINEVLDALAEVSERIHLRFLWRPRLADPGDEMVLETAVSGRSDYLITFDVRHLKHVGGEFGIRVCTPGEYWKQRGGSAYETK